MHQDYWHQRWQLNQIEFNQLQPNQLMQNYFSSLKMKPGSFIFVPLCGKSIDMIWLAQQGYNIIGVECSQIACDSFFQENKLPVKITKKNNFIIYESNNILIYLGDFFQLNKKNLKQIDAVYDRAALNALPIDLRKSYADHLINLIDISTQMLLLTITYNEFTLRGPPFSVNETEINTLYGMRFNIKKLCYLPQDIDNTMIYKQAYLLSANIKRDELRQRLGNQLSIK